MKRPPSSLVPLAPLAHRASWARKPTQFDVVAAIQTRGSDADGLRDAAHEACHALSVDLRTPWDRESIHSAVVKKCRSGDALLAEEIFARAVERKVVEHFGERYDDEHWLFICALESVRNGIFVPSIDRLRFAIQCASKERRVAVMADRIVSLACPACGTDSTVGCVKEPGEKR